MNPSSESLLAQADRDFAAARDFATDLLRTASEKLESGIDPTVVWAKFAHNFYQDTTALDTDEAIRTSATALAATVTAVASGFVHAYRDGNDSFA